MIDLDRIVDVMFVGYLCVCTMCTILVAAFLVYLTILILAAS